MVLLIVWNIRWLRLAVRTWILSPRIARITRIMSFDPHANPVKEVWNNGRLHLRAFFLSSRQSRESRESLFYYV